MLLSRVYAYGVRLVPDRTDISPFIGADEIPPFIERSTIQHGLVADGFRLIKDRGHVASLGPAQYALTRFLLDKGTGIEVRLDEIAEHFEEHEWVRSSHQEQRLAILANSTAKKLTTVGLTILTGEHEPGMRRIVEV